MNPRLLPTVMIIECVAAAVVYALARDVKNAVYWTATAIALLAVSWL